ncbi:hypothetical protein FRC11_005875 [Ceratobasidium sp. 423]|nr:hypothetical protein FRC11_005875 [Ceratobasidium sp. 423]
MAGYATTFTIDEINWLHDHYLQAYVACKKSQPVKVQNIDFQSLDTLLDHIVEAFGNAFPHRHPGTAVDAIPKHLRTLQLPSLHDWPEMRNNIENELTRLKKTHVDGVRVITTYEAPPGYAIVDSGDTAPNTKPASTSPPALLGNWHQTVKELNHYLKRSWAQCDSIELTRRQVHVAELMRQLCLHAGYTTGCELYITGAMAAEGGPKAFHTTTPRSQSYLGTTEAFQSMQHFAAFTAKYIGSALCISTECPGAVVTGDTDRDNYPLLPDEAPTLAQDQRNLFDFFSAVMQWQGGGPVVPYEQIQREAESDQWNIVPQTSLPSGVSYLRNPMLMSRTEVGIWRSYIRAGRNSEIPGPVRFQFKLRQPNDPSDNPNELRPTGSILSYGPDALQYRRFLNRFPTAKPQKRSDNLPLFNIGDPVYNSFNRGLMEDYRKALGASDPATQLLDLVDEHDECYPRYATETNWADRVAYMPHLKRTPPGPNESINQLFPEDGWLPIEFYDFREPKHFLTGLVRTLEWCMPKSWKHAPSDTLLGGPFGVKWAVIVLLHVRLNANIVQADFKRARMHYGSNPTVEFSSRDITQLDSAIIKVAGALRDSIARLSQSKQQRMYGDQEAQARAILALSHEKFSLRTETFTWCQPVASDYVFTNTQAEVDSTSVAGLSRADAGAESGGCRRVTFAEPHSNNM